MAASIGKSIDVGIIPNNRPPTKAHISEPVAMTKTMKLCVNNTEVLIGHLFFYTFFTLIGFFITTFLFS